MSNPEPNPPKLARIDFSSQKMKGKSGKTYFIQSELSAIRYPQFLAYQPVIAKGASYAEWAATNNEIHALATTGNEVVTQLHKIAMITMNQNNTWKDFTQKRTVSMVWFCMLFINAEDEDVGEWDTRVVELKIADLDHYSIQDFFVLGQNILKDWRKAFQSQTGHAPSESVPSDKNVAEILTQKDGDFTSQNKGSKG